MNLTGKMTIFPKDLGKGEKKFRIFETSFARKSKEGKYVDNYSMRVEFTETLLPESKREKLLPENCYQIEVEEAFISTNGFDTKEGKRVVEPKIVVSKGKILSFKAIAKKAVDEKIVEDDNLPF